MPRRSTVVLLATLLLAAPLHASTPDVHEHRGDITVDVLWGHGIAAAVDVAPADGVIDRLYILQKASRAPSELPIHHPDGKLIHGPGTVIVTGALDSRPILLLLDDPGRADIQSELSSRAIGGLALKRRMVGGAGGAGDASDASDASDSGQGAPLDQPLTWTGFGLVHRTGAWAAPFSSLAGESRVMTKETCKSGGFGSTQCSVTCRDSTQCETTCSAGYYACCSCVVNAAECSCVAEPGGVGGWGGGGGGGDDSCVTDSYCPASCISCSPLYDSPDDAPDSVPGDGAGS